MAGGAVIGEEGFCVAESGGGWFPGLDHFEALGEVCLALPGEKFDELISPGIVVFEEVAIGGHGGTGAEGLGVDEVLLKPGVGAAVSDVEEVGTGAAVADGDRGFFFELVERDDWSPLEKIGAIGPDVAGVAVDATFGKVDLVAGVAGVEVGGGLGR